MKINVKLIIKITSNIQAFLNILVKLRGKFFQISKKINILRVVKRLYNHI